MWHDAIISPDYGGAECKADPGRVCRHRLFGDVSICVKCGEPRRFGGGRTIRVERRSPGRTREERLENWRRKRALEIVITVANAEEIPF